MKDEQSHILLYIPILYLLYKCGILSHICELISPYLVIILIASRGPGLLLIYYGRGEVRMVRKVIKFLDLHFEEYLMAGLMITLTLVMLFQIVMRYIFNSSMSWPEELCRYCFVYITFLTMGYCIQRNSMLRLDIIKEILPRRAWGILQAFVKSVSLLFFFCMMIASFDLLESVQKTSRVTPALGIPYVFIYLSTVIGFALGLLRSVQSIIGSVSLFLAKRKEAHL